MKRKFLSLLSACLSIVIFATSANAAIISDHLLTGEELEEAMQNPEVTKYTTCTGGNGICQMYAQGYSYVIDEDGCFVDGLGNCWQCKNCYTVMATDGDPKLGYAIGHYVVVPCDYDLKLSVVNYLYVDSSDIQYCSTKYLEGYEFHYN